MGGLLHSDGHHSVRTRIRYRHWAALRNIISHPLQVQSKDWKFQHEVLVDSNLMASNVTPAAPHLQHWSATSPSSGLDRTKRT